MELLYNAIFLEDSSSEIEQHVPYFPVYMRCTFFPIKSWNISLGIICSRSGSRVSFVLCCTSCLLMLHYSCLQTASYTLVCLVYQKIRYFDSLFTWYSILDVRFQSHLWRSRTLQRRLTSEMTVPLLQHYNIGSFSSVNVILQ